MPKYFPHVDGLRSVAVLAVIIYHLNSKLLPGGFVGVDIFFAISGFVVTASLANHKGESFLGFLGFFYSRRLARITPALVVMLFVTTVAYVLFVPRSWFNEMADTVGQAAFWGVSNWILDQSAINYFEPRAEFNPFTHTWSLGVEEQYYLVAPLLLFKWISWRAHSPRRKLAIGIMALLAAISLSACIYFAILHGPRFVFYQITFRFWELAAGVIWYQLMAEQANFGKNFDWFWDIGGWLGLFIIAILFFLPNPEAYPWIRGLFAVIGSVLLIGSPKRIKNDGIVKRVLGSQSMVWIGLHSYSLYLWHWPIYVLFRWTVGLELWPFNVLSIVLIVLIATFSYRWIEQPIRQSTKLKSVPIRWRIAGFLIFLGLGWLSSNRLIESQPLLGLGLPTQQPLDWYSGGMLVKSVYQSSRKCEPHRYERKLAGANVRAIEFYPENCMGQAEKRLFVIGDSHATAYLPMFEQLSAEQIRNVTVFQEPSCGYLELVKLISGTKCSNILRAELNDLLITSKEGDLVFLPSLRLPRFIGKGGTIRPSREEEIKGINVYQRSNRERQLIHAAINEATEWLEPLKKAGLTVIFEAPKPIFRAPPFRCVDFFNRLNPDCKYGLVESVENQENYRAPIIEGIKTLAAKYPNVSIWDPLPLLCGREACRAMQGDRPLFFDADHVSPYGNVVLYPSFKQMINSF